MMVEVGCAATGVSVATDAEATAAAASATVVQAATALFALEPPCWKLV